MEYRKKMIEVALPLEAINKAAAREKSIRHGHPSTLHLWWARRPLAACRAVLFASLVDDPDSDPAYRQADGTVDEDRAGVKRAELFNLIEELVLWENSNNPQVLNRARAEIARCVASRKIELGELKKETIVSGRDKGKRHPAGPISRQGVTAWEVVLMQAGPQVVSEFLVDHAPPVLDPFCGGGSIPLEAQRLGLRAYASDLNPVAVLITKALIEIPPKFAGKPPVNPNDRNAQMEWPGASGLAADVRYYGQWMRDEAAKRIGHLYPKVKVTAEMAKDRPDLKPYVGQELTVIAWLWARTVASPNPTCKGAHVPLVRSFWLSTKKGKEAWARPVIDKGGNAWHFEAGVGKPPAGFDPGTGTIGRKGGRCILTNVPMGFPHVRAEGQVGRMGQRLMAIVAEGTRGRVYLSPLEEHVKIAESAQPSWKPDAQLPHNPRDFKTPNYGMTTFASLFTNRQLMALVTFSDLVSKAREKALADARAAGTLPADDRPLADGGTGATAYADAVATYLAFAVDRSADAWSTIASWRQGVEATRGTFGRQALPMVWDFAEANPFSAACGNWNDAAIEWIVKAIAHAPASMGGSAKQLDATTAINGVARPAISTDPPYYDNIGYADLSDFFYVWLRRSIGKVFPEICSTVLVPKAQELVATPYRFGGDKEKAERFFEEGLGKAFSRMRDAHHTDYPLTVYYAFKQAETEEESEDEPNDNATSVVSTGWETMLQGLIRAGFCITGTWPMRTERPGKITAMMNILASSIVLVCRQMPGDTPLATRRDFLAGMKQELPLALKNLQWGSVAPVDLAQAAIGPGMAVFTRYSKVMEADGSTMTVRTALGLINQALDEVLAEQEGEFDADTRWALAWFEQSGMDEGPFGVAETLSKAKNTSVAGMVEAGVVAARGGKVKLLGRDDLPADWDPATDERLTVWEITQYLIRALEQHGEGGAAALLKKVGGMGEVARDLAYRLYVICERKKWAQEALAYNSLVVAWPEITRLAREASAERPRVRQPDLENL